MSFRYKAGFIQEFFNPLTAGPATDFSLFGWGQNNQGQLGQANIVYRSSPVQIGSLITWSNISGGSEFFNAIQSNGTLWSWGSNSKGQLGINLDDNNSRSSPVQVGNLTNWSKAFSGNQSAFAIKTDGTLWAWGRNVVGELGLGNKVYRSSPTQVGSLTTWLTVSVNYSGAIAVKTDGTLWGWGSSLYGQLGNSNTIYRSSPTQIGSGTTWLSVACGEYHVVARQSSGSLWAWGRNASGQLGDITNANRSSPVQIGALTTWSIVSAAYNTSFAIKTDGTLWAWGQNNYGQLGQNNGIYTSSPVQVGSLTVWSSLAFPSSASSTSAAIKNDNSLWAWGSNTYGQLGQNNRTNYSSPVQVGSGTWYKVAATQNATVAIASA